MSHHFHAVVTTRCVPQGWLSTKRQNYNLTVSPWCLNTGQHTMITRPMDFTVWAWHWKKADLVLLFYCVAAWNSFIEKELHRMWFVSHNNLEPFVSLLIVLMQDETITQNAEDQNNLVHVFRLIFTLCEEQPTYLTHVGPLCWFTHHSLLNQVF